MPVREVRGTIAPAATASFLPADRPQSRVRAIVGAMLGVPTIVILAMAALIAFDEHPIPVPAQHIELRYEGGGTGTAIVFGAGTGLHLVRISSTGVPVAADLSAGPLRLMSLRTLHLDARGVTGKNISVSASGHVLRLQRMGEGVVVRTGM